MKNEHKKVLLRLFNEKSYVSLKGICLNHEKIIDIMYESLTSEEKLNDSPKTDKHKNVHIEMDRLWGFIDNLSQKQGEELDWMSDLFPKICSLVNKDLNL